MQALTQPIEHVLDNLRLFLGMPEVRAMHVRTTSQLLPVIVGAVTACESKGGNRSPMLLLLTPTSRRNLGWDGRELELRSEQGDLRDAARDAEIELDAVAPAAPHAGLTGFALTLAAVARSLRAPLSGLVVVLVPGAGSSALAPDLSALWSQPGLRSVRWIILESSADLRAPVAALSNAGMVIDAVPSDDALADELRRRADAVASAPADVGGPAAVGCAGPGIKAPRRPHEGPETPPEVLQRVAAEQGVSAAYADPQVVKEIRAAVLAAMAAAASKDFVVAVQQFGVARDACLRASLQREAITYELTMGAVALPHAPAAACETFATARNRAIQIGETTLATRAELGRAGALVALHRSADAAIAYRHAGDLAGPQEPVMAIEAYRMCGQLLAADGREQDAVAVWRRALDLADQTDPVARVGSTAPMTARALADLCDRHALRAQATSLRHQADRLEAAVGADALHPMHTLSPVAAGAE